MNIRPRQIPPPAHFAPTPELKKEINTLYSVKVTQNGRPFHKGCDTGGSVATNGDTDRLHGGYCNIQHSRDHWTITTGSPLNIQKVEVPPGTSYFDDITYDSQQNKVAAQGYNQQSQRWELSEFAMPSSLEGHLAFPKSLPAPQGQVIYSSDIPCESLEWGADGRLLLAQGQEVLTLEPEGKLAPLHHCPGPVQDLNILSDGALLVKVESTSPAQSDLLYFPQGQSDPAALPLNLSRPNGGWQEWMSPAEGNSVAAFREDDHWQLHARDTAWEYGDLLQEVSSAFFPGEHTLEANSLKWSPDGQFFKATTLHPRGLSGKVRDSLLWDSHSKQAKILPRIESVTFDQGQVVLEGLAETLRLEPQQLENLEQQDWYQRNLQLPAVTLQGDSQVHLTFRDGKEQDLLKDGERFHLRLSQNQQHVVGLAKDYSKAKIWDLLSGQSVETPRGFEVRWEEKSQLLTLTGPEGQKHSSSLSELRHQPWYRQALEELVFQADPAGPGQAQGPIVKEEDGTRYNGLLLPKKGPTS